jgi:hypothetical protein
MVFTTPGILLLLRVMGQRAVLLLELRLAMWLRHPLSQLPHQTHPPLLHLTPHQTRRPAHLPLSLHRRHRPPRRLADPRH